ncbi:MAG: hypothetical protein KVP17_003957 [Porospora cf. gigantea B]|uniref:uncharacterized protein n=1 Tax=Porospora cf. gigantea B TaxID=2853592 RepID=UPI003571A212|nr:MAG: hypothetical protein KVP17_003957 [Porospora cf. gigantea B]
MSPFEDIERASQRLQEDGMCFAAVRILDADFSMENTAKVLTGLANVVSRVRMALFPRKLVPGPVGYCLSERLDQYISDFAAWSFILDCTETQMNVSRFDRLGFWDVAALCDCFTGFRSQLQYLAGSLAQFKRMPDDKHIRYLSDVVDQYLNSPDVAYLKGESVLEEVTFCTFALLKRATAVWDHLIETKDVGFSQLLKVSPFREYFQDGEYHHQENRKREAAVLICKLHRLHPMQCLCLVRRALDSGLGFPVCWYFVEAALRMCILQNCENNAPRNPKGFRTRGMFVASWKKDKPKMKEESTPDLVFAFAPPVFPNGALDEELGESL